MVDKPIRRRILLGGKEMEMKYVQDRSITNLERRVNDFLEDGWQLFAPLSNLNGSYVQTIVLIKEE